MAFSGVELLEPVGEDLQGVISGDGFVYSLNKGATSNSISIMNTSTGSAVLYSTGTTFADNGQAYHDGEKAYFISGSKILTCDKYGSILTVNPSGEGITSGQMKMGNGIVVTNSHIILLFIYNEYPVEYPTKSLQQSSRRYIGVFNKSTLGFNLQYYIQGSSDYISSLGLYDDIVYGTNPYYGGIYAYTDLSVDTTKTTVAYLPTGIVAHGTATEKNNWLWWKVNSKDYPIVGYNPITNSVRLISLSPSGMPYNGTPWYQWAIDDNEVAYRINEDNETMLAVDLNSGKWKIDDLPTIRSGRYGVAYANGKLWIPSTVTPD